MFLPVFGSVVDREAQGCREAVQGGPRAPLGYAELFQVGRAGPGWSQRVQAAWCLRPHHTALLCERVGSGSCPEARRTDTHPESSWRSPTPAPRLTDENIGGTVWPKTLIHEEKLVKCVSRKEEAADRSLSVLVCVCSNIKLQGSPSLIPRGFISILLQ